MVKTFLKQMIQNTWNVQFYLYVSIFCVDKQGRRMRQFSQSFCNDLQALEYICFGT